MLKKERTREQKCSQILTIWLSIKDYLVAMEQARVLILKLRGSDLPVKDSMLQGISSA
jgi:hypothetical protein